MKRCLSLLVLWLACSASAAGQNLVPNGSFEYKNACPTGFSNIQYSPGYTLFPTVQDWVSPTVGSPDYYHVCGSSNWSVPFSIFGYQQARSGSARTGFYMYGYSQPGSPSTLFDAREYIECRLRSPMQAGHTYHVLFYTVVAENPNSSFNIVGVDKIGAQFTTAQISVSANTLPMGNGITSQPGVPIADTQNWSRVEGFYTAGGAEEWMTIGHFTDNVPVVYAIVRPAGTTASSNYFIAYSFLDDVVVTDVATPDVVHASSLSVCSTALPLTLNGVAGGDEFQWQNGSTAATFSATAPGTYWVRTWKDTVYYVDTFHIAVHSFQTLHLPADTMLCNGGTISIGANQPFLSYAWNTGANTPSITVGQSGQYILSVTDSCGSQRDTVNVFISHKLHLPADTLLCNNGQITISANAAFPAYQWSTGATTSSILISQSGQYILSVSDACGPQKDTMNVTVRPPIPLPLTRDTVLCKGVIGPKLFVSGDSIRWYVPPLNNGTFLQPPLNTGAAGTQTIYITQTRGGCESARQPMVISVLAPPAVGLGRDTAVCDSTALLIGPSVPPGTSVLWNTGETFSPIVVRKGGYYRITLANVCGSASDDKIVSYSDCDSTPPPGSSLLEGCLYIPTAFTPNGDGRNDRFRVISICPVQRYRIMIRNRRGETVYEGTDIDDSWDGMLHGVPAAADTYFYYMEFLKANTGNVPDKIKGDLLLVR